MLEPITRAALIGSSFRDITAFELTQTLRGDGAVDALIKEAQQANATTHPQYLNIVANRDEAVEIIDALLLIVEEGLPQLDSGG